jgi:hypothetical protein
MTRDEIETVARVGQLPGVQFPKLFPAMTEAGHHASILEYMEVLGDGLPGHLGSHG